MAAATRYECQNRDTTIEIQFTGIAKKRGPSLRWSPSTVGALPGMCSNR